MQHQGLLYIFLFFIREVFFNSVGAYCNIPLPSPGAQSLIHKNVIRVRFSCPFLFVFHGHESRSRFTSLPPRNPLFIKNVNRVRFSCPFLFRPSRTRVPATIHVLLPSQSLIHEGVEKNVLRVRFPCPFFSKNCATSSASY